jgi:transposase-like protein
MSVLRKWRCTPIRNVKREKRYTCNDPECSLKIFYAEYPYNGCKPDAKKAVIKWAIDGAGIRAIAREIEASSDTVIKELKKENPTDYVNKEYLKSHNNITVGVEVEMDKMGSFCPDKKHQIWLFFFGWIFLVVGWRAIDRETGTVIAFWFWTRNRKSLGNRLELIAPHKTGKP